MVLRRVTGEDVVAILHRLVAGEAIFVQLAAQTLKAPRTCQMARSDPVPMPRTSLDVVADLHALLRAATDAYRSPGLNGNSSPGGTLSSLIARIIATVM